MKVPKNALETALKIALEITLEIVFKIAFKNARNIAIKAENLFRNSLENLP